MQSQHAELFYKIVCCSEIEKSTALDLHSIPKNEVVRRKWLNAIGLENLNPRHKTLRICSLHFEESQFNKTLDLIRLREDAVPTLFIMPSTSQVVTGLCDMGNG